MTTNPNIPALQPFLGEHIPASLRSQKRWAPWKAVFNEKRQKVDKIPYHAKHNKGETFSGLSTGRAENWYTYQAAEAALLANPSLFAGLGYCMTGPHGVVGIDLDDCITEGIVAPWAQAIVDDVASYTEISPSGKGLRIWSEGSTEQDYTDHKVGIEVYSGHAPRFLTVTGQHVAGTPDAVTVPAASVLPDLAAKYMKVKASSVVVALRAPEVLDELCLPDIASLDLNSRARAFLEDGTSRGDNSGELFASSVALYAALQGEHAKDSLDQIVYSMLLHNKNAMDVGLTHRRNDEAAAEHYIWAHHCQTAGAKASASSFNFDDFDDVMPDMAPATAQKAVIDSAAAFSTDDFDDESADHAPAVSPTKAVAPTRFDFKQAAEYVKRAPSKWLIKRVIPHATLGVLYGESGAGKSFFMLDLVLAIARGAEWQGHKVTQGGVAYICAEGASGFSLRLQALAEHNGLRLADIPLYILDAAPNFLERKDIVDLITAIRALPDIKLIVVDTLAQVTPGGDENSAVDMGKALSHSQALARKTGNMVILVAHSGKDSSRGIRGWSGVKGALDVEIKVERDKQKRTATISKIKDGVGEDAIYPFALDSVVLGHDEDGDEITSCVIKLGEPTTQAAVSNNHLKGDVQIAVMTQLEALCDFDGPVPADTLIKAVVASLPQDPTKPDRRRDVVVRAIKALELGKRLTLTAGMIELVAP